MKKCWNCGKPIGKIHIAVQHGTWNGIFCSEDCLSVYSQKQDKIELVYQVGVRTQVL